MLLGFCNKFLKLRFFQDYVCVITRLNRCTNDKSARNITEKKARFHIEQDWLHDSRNVESQS